MKLQKTPSFRKDDAPRHHADLLGLLISAFSALVFFFSVQGVGVALENDPYQRHVWVPVLLMFLSGILLVWNLFRILRRILLRSVEEE